MFLFSSVHLFSDILYLLGLFHPIFIISLNIFIKVDLKYLSMESFALLNILRHSSHSSLSPPPLLMGHTFLFVCLIGFVETSHFR